MSRGVERNTGVAGNSPTGAAMQANAAVGNAMTTPAPGLVGQAGSLVGAGQMLPPAWNTFGTYGPMRGGLMDPRNYSQNQGFLGCQGHGCSGCTACQGYPGQGVHGQGLLGQGQFRTRSRRTRSDRTRSGRTRSARTRDARTRLHGNSRSRCPS